MDTLKIFLGYASALALASCELSAHIADNGSAGAAGEASDAAGGGAGSTATDGSGGRVSATGGAQSTPSGGSTSREPAGGAAGVARAGTGGAMGTAGAGAAGAAPIEPLVLCDGKDHLRFATQSAGGNYNGVPKVLQEIGYSFLVIDGHCQYWVVDSWDNREVRTGTLTRDQADAFSKDLELGQWGDHVPKGCPDAGSTTLRFADDTITFSCESSDILTNLGTWTTHLYGVGAALDGDMRYSVSRGGSTSGWPESDQVDDVPSWLLDVDPGTVSAELPELAVTQVAEGDDARLLRQLRARYVAAPLTAPDAPWLGIPVVYDGGSKPAYYDVAVRDVTPFETDGQFSPEEYF
jgi:hypothetical protein